MRKVLRVAAWAALAVSLVTLAGCSKNETASNQPEQKPFLRGETVAEGNPPENIVFPNSYGEVTFNHRKHYERVGGDCSTCHPKVFPQALELIHYKKALHRAAEASRSACAS